MQAHVSSCPERGNDTRRMNTIAGMQSSIMFPVPPWKFKNGLPNLMKFEELIPHRNQYMDNANSNNIAHC
jgi:hypothetical protein